MRRMRPLVGSPLFVFPFHLHDEIQACMYAPRPSVAIAAALSAKRRSAALGRREPAMARPARIIWLIHLPGLHVLRHRVQVAPTK